LKYISTPIKESVTTPTAGSGWKPLIPEGLECNILTYASNLNLVKLQAIHTTIKYTTRYSQLGKTIGPENQKTKVW
jgi:hypothetical protein